MAKFESGKDGQYLTWLVQVFKCGRKHLQTTGRILIKYNPNTWANSPLIQTDFKKFKWISPDTKPLTKKSFLVDEAITQISWKVQYIIICNLKSYIFHVLTFKVLSWLEFHQI